MKRVIILILDSFGIGSTADSDKYGDKGSDTLGHIVERCVEGTATGTVKREKLADWDVLNVTIHLRIGL